MPKAFDKTTEQYYLKINEDPFNDNVELDLVDSSGAVVQNFIKITSLGIYITPCPIAVAHKAGMFGNQCIKVDGKQMMIAPEVTAVVTPINSSAEAA
jgi:hypothetical protein